MLRTELVEPFKTTSPELAAIMFTFLLIFKVEAKVSTVPGAPTMVSPDSAASTASAKVS